MFPIIYIAMLTQIPDMWAWLHIYPQTGTHKMAMDHEQSCAAGGVSYNMCVNELICMSYIIFAVFLLQYVPLLSRKSESN